MSAPPTIDDEVRAMLARRAADIGPEDLAPGLPTGVRVSLVDDRAARRRPRLPVRWAAAAAVLLVVAGVAGAVVAARPDDGVAERARTGTEPTAPGDPGDPGGPTVPPDLAERPAHLSSLPAGVDPTVGPVLSVGPSGATPEAASDAAMVGVGDDVTPNEPFAVEGRPSDGIWAASRAPLFDLGPENRGSYDVDAMASTVTARRDEAGAWQVVAVTSTALDLTEVRYDAAGGLRGTVRSTLVAPLRVVVTTGEGEVLATTSLNTATVNAAGPSRLVLDGLLEVTAGQPVVLRVEVGDGEGQVGLDGVGVASYAAVVLPGWGPAAAGDPTTTEPVPAADPLVAGLPVGLEVEDLAPLWDAPSVVVGDGDESDMAWGYLMDRLVGDPAGDGRTALTMSTQATSDPDVQLIRWSVATSPDGRSGTLVLRRDDGVWAVVAALSDAFDLSAVRAVDGWFTGEVGSTWPGEWWTTTVASGGFTPEQVGTIVAYVRSLDDGEASAPATPAGALPERPSDLGPGPVALYAVADGDLGEGPFVEMVLAG